MKPFQFAGFCAILAKCPIGVNIQQDAAISDFGNNELDGEREK